MNKEFKFCKCGCGLYTLGSHDYIKSHEALRRYLEREQIKEQNKKKNKKKREDETKHRKEDKKKKNRKPCKCGCGELANSGRIFLPGHWSKSIEGRARIRNNRIGKPRPDELREHLSKIKTGVPRTEQDKLQMKEGWKKKRLRESKWEKSKLKKLERKRAKGIFIKSYGKDSRKVIHIRVHDKLTKSEEELRMGLNDLFPNEYKFVGNGLIFIGFKCPDFMSINGQKKIIEMFGDYWHSEKATGIPVEEHQRQRIKHFAEYGFKTLIIWQKELKNISQLKKKLIKFHYS